MKKNYKAPEMLNLQPEESIATGEIIAEKSGFFDDLNEDEV